MKIYTKKGDTGQTSLIGGKRVSKAHLRIDTYGTVDELNSYIGLIRDQKIDEHIRDVLEKIQNNIFIIGASLASDPEKSKKDIPDLKDEDIMTLEKEMDTMSAALPALKYFILPGGHTIVSFCHIARSVCRRAERLCVTLSLKEPVNGLTIQYLNRLGDYLFVLSRKLGKNLNIEEINWQSGK